MNVVEPLIYFIFPTSDLSFTKSRELTDFTVELMISLSSVNVEDIKK